MNTLFKRTGIFVLAVGLASLIGFSAKTLAEQVAEKQENVNVVKRETMANGAFQYVVSKKDGSQEVEVDISPTKNSPTLQDLNSYRNEMPNQFTILKNKGYDKIPVAITMRQPISGEEFKTFVTENGLSVEGYEIRVIDENGMRGTMGARPIGTDLYPQERIKEFLGNSKNIKGIYMIKGTMPVKQEIFDKLQNDQRVFVVDVSQKVVEDQIQNSPEFKQLTGPKHMDIHLPNIYWSLEDLTQKNGN